MTTPNQERINTWDKVTRGIKNPDKLFDLCIWGAYFAGGFKGQIPVEESRKVFEKIKKIIIKNNAHQKHTTE